MKFLQIVCLYNKKNVFFKQNFKAIAYSEGITVKERKEIEATSLNEFISTANSCKDEVIDSICSFKLNSGRHCILNTKASFSHGFIIDEGNFPFYPIQIIGSDSFIDDINKLKKIETGRGSLPYLSNISIGSYITFESVSQFIKGKIGGTLKDMINAVIEHKETNKRLIICDSKDNVPFWIGAIQMAFPVYISSQISFSTSGNINDEDVLIIGINDLNDMKDIKTVESKIYLFDLNNYVKSVLEVDYKFNRLVEYSYLVSRESLNLFHEFSKKFNYNSIDAGLDIMYSFYSIVSYGIGNMEESDVVSAINFASEFILKDSIEDILIKLQSVYDKISRELNIKTAEHMLKFVFKGIQNTEDVFIINSVCKFMFYTFDNVVFEENDSGYKAMLNLYDDIIKLANNRADNIRKYFLNSDKLEYITYRIIERGISEYAGLYLQLIMKNFIDLEYSWNEIGKEDKSRIFIETSMTYALKSKEIILGVINIISEEEDFLYELVSILYDNYNSEDKLWLGKILNTQFKKLKTERLLDIRKRFYFSGKADLIFEEYKEGLKTNQEKTDYFNDYFDNVVYEVPDYGKEYYSKIVYEYLNIMKYNISVDEYLKIFKNIISNKYEFDDDNITLLIKNFEDRCNLNMPDEEIQGLLINIDKLKIDKGIKTCPDILSIIIFGIYIYEINIDKHLYSIKDITRKKMKIENLDGERYKQCLKWCIPKIIEFVNLPEDNKLINYIFNSNGMDEDYYEEYFNAILGIIDREKDSGYDVLLNFIIYFFYYVEPQYRFIGDKKVISKVITGVANLILKCPVEYISKVDNDIREEFSDKGLSTPILWNELYKKISRR